jgi:hypothetical protein
MRLNYVGSEPEDMVDWEISTGLQHAETTKERD